MHWLATDFAVRNTVGFVHCWVHVSEGTISTSSKASIKSDLRAKQPWETLLNFLSQESLTARKDALMGTLHSQAKLPLESLPLLCQLIKPQFSQREVQAQFWLWKIKCQQLSGVWYNQFYWYAIFNRKCLNIAQQHKNLHLTTKNTIQIIPLASTDGIVQSKSPRSLIGWLVTTLNFSYEVVSWMLPWGGFVWYVWVFFLGDRLQWTPIKAFGRFLINITLKLWSNLSVKHGQPMRICPSNDPVNAAGGKKSRFQKLGVSSPHTTLVHSPISLCCRDSSPPPSISGLLTKLIMAASDCKCINDIQGTQAFVGLGVLEHCPVCKFFFFQWKCNGLLFICV